MALLVRLDLDCRVVDVEFVLAELCDLVECVAWVDISHDVRGENRLAFAE